MSSRAIRKLQKLREQEQLQESEQQDESSDDEPRRPAKPKFNAFDLLNAGGDDDDNDSENDGNEHEEDEEEAKPERQPQADPEPAPTLHCAHPNAKKPLSRQQRRLLGWRLSDAPSDARWSQYTHLCSSSCFAAAVPVVHCRVAASTFTLIAITTTSSPTPLHSSLSASRCIET